MRVYGCIMHTHKHTHIKSSFGSFVTVFLQIYTRAHKNFYQKFPLIRDTPDL